MEKNFLNSVKMSRPNRNRFDLSHDVKLSFDMGELIPVCAIDVLPGDKFNIGCESLIRFQPLVAPVMHRMDVTVHYFFVPNRILWPNWEKYMANNDGNSPLPAHPYFNIGGPGNANYSRLMDYMGIPPITGENILQVNALPFAAYQRIYDEYYRDQNLIDQVTDLQLVDGDNTAKTWLWDLQNRAWEHDYFTACLPWAQKGAPVSIPLGNFQDVPVKINDNTGSTITATPSNIPVDGEEVDEPLIPADTLYAETSLLDAEATTINELRFAFRLQEWLEKMARGGSRYTEIIRAFWGVVSSDARLQRPEYITGIKTPVVISEVLNTTGTEDAPQGNMAGHGISVTSGKYGSYFAEEHGWIIGIMSVMPKTAYQQGVAKKFFRLNSPTEYFWQQFQHIGEQAVKVKELYADTTTVNQEEDFGYIPRYGEYRFEPNRVAGEMRSSLSFWHLGRIFADKPVLNGEFITCVPRKDVFAVTAPAEEVLIGHVYNKISASRMMSKYGTPTF